MGYTIQLPRHASKYVLAPAADIIYHLFDAFTTYNAEIVEAKRRDAAPMAVWPCRLRIIACFCKRDPIILGVDILDGALRLGTPLCVVKNDPATAAKEIIELGKMYAFISHVSWFVELTIAPQHFFGNQSQVYGGMCEEYWL